MEHQAVFEERVPITPKELNRLSDETAEIILLEKLRTKLENRCSKHGFVIPGSLEIISRSMGLVEVGRFTGDIVYQVQAQGKVLNPSDGLLLTCEVLKKNKMGIYVEYKDAIRVLLPRDLHIGNIEFDALIIGDNIEVEIKKSRFQVNDPFILCVGIYKSKISSGTVNAGNAGNAEAEVDEGTAEEANNAESDGEVAEGEVQEEEDDDDIETTFTNMALQGEAVPTNE
jgi:DNA-directed RNA polymerase subunit E'/Rpb7